MWSFRHTRHSDGTDRGQIRAGRLVTALASLLVAASIVTLAPAAATAQQSDSAETSSASDSGEQSGPEPEVDPDADNYWSKVREVYTVQKRPFEKVNRLSVTLYGGLIPNNIFERYYPVGLRLNYFILENIGLELAGSYAFTQKTPVNDVAGESSGINANDIRIGDSQVSHSNFGIVWSPFYGKSALYDEDIGYFDLFVMGGVGLAVTQTRQQINQPPETTAKTEGVLGAGLAWYFPDHAAVRLDYRQFVFQKVTGGVANPSEVSLGATWFF
jgi:outer membrane beta-barrel protein